MKTSKRAREAKKLDIAKTDPGAPLYGSPEGRVSTARVRI